ncbi:MAG: ABC transporter substrate-binding protein [Chloroflexota bacterium]|nr:ABC transporter substrate-binding protein [Chloroflexota bacterium]MDE2898100.1 ABC transporter substrate-binding protein [Chloroflexota bacterium]
MNQIAATPRAWLVVLGLGGLVALIIVLWAVLAAGGATTATDGQPPVATATVEPVAVSSPQTPTGAPGVSAERVLFGQSAAFSGPASELGLNMRLGIQAAFEEANQAGGVHGRRLELTTLDDAYEPEAAVTNTKQLIEQENVFALIGAVGTPTSRSAVPVAVEANTPYLAPFTGAGFLRGEDLHNVVVNLRASYNQETEEMVDRLTKDLGITRIALLYQDDSYGRAGYNGVQAALERRGMTLAAVGVYPRNTTAVKTALLDLREGQPEAVIMVGAYEPVAALVAWSRHLGFIPVFMTISFVGSNALAQELGPEGAGVFVTQVVPFPTDTSLPVVQAYHRALAAFDSDAVPGFVSFEGYLAGRLTILGLERCGADLSRDCFLNSLRSAEEIDGFKLRFESADNQGSDAVFLTVIGADGRYRSVSSLSGR